LPGACAHGAAGVPRAGGAVVSLEAPFPWFGGKSRVADEVWQRFGDVPNYVEPFFGSGAVLLGRPEWHTGRIETVNDKDGFVSNFWRAVQHDPEQTAYYADWPVNENDLHARHAWLVKQQDSLVARLEGDPEFYDPKIAGWWVWGICCWIGGGFCSGNGPWVVDPETRKLVHLGGAGQGVNRQRELLSWFKALAERLRGVRVCSGDWTRVCGPTPTFKNGLTGVFLDPPYQQDSRADVYRVEEPVNASVRAWAIENGRNPLLRIALCGYEGEHEMPEGWEVYCWQANGGYGLQGGGRGRENRKKERTWFSPACLKPEGIQAVLL
jgi:DNA adenine methylase